MSEQAIAAHRGALKRQTIARAIRMRHIYLLLLLSLTLLVVFKYGPIYGLIIAFKDYNFYDGVLGSPWNDFAHFRRLFKDPFFLRVFFNTFWLSVLRLLLGFPCPIILALLLNEVRVSLYQRVVQTISYLPHFISWVILAGILTEILSPQRGIVAYFYTLLGLEPVHWLTNKATSAACWWSPASGRGSAGAASSIWRRCRPSIRGSTRAPRSTARTAGRKRCASLSRP